MQCECATFNARGWGPSRSSGLGPGRPSKQAAATPHLPSPCHFISQAIHLLPLTSPLSTLMFHLTSAGAIEYFEVVSDCFKAAFHFEGYKANRGP